MPLDSKRVQAVFLAAVEAADCDAVLARECGDDAELRQRVEALLQAHDQPGSFLDQPAAPEISSDVVPGRFIDPAEVPRLAEGPGSRIGPYKLLQLLGEGGMGAVYMAEQEEPVKRRVALKIIKVGMDSAHVIARFEQERQALAMMDHPNIARVLDAGATEAGRPYVVMELVKGIPITKYCDQEHLTPKERLDLFIPVCHAVQHAHQKGIIHRDIKPSNVLIALYDCKPVSKVIDFGVAKATAQKLTERTMFTEVGQIVGTLEYMAPEQAELNNLDIDTRADIYSLGVLLYELLTGSPPFTRKQLRSAGFEAMLRVIREVEPLKPSTKLSTSEELPSIAVHRRLEPAKLTKLVRGDLDWIVMKCLEKERGRRYETANGLAMDVQRYLADELVLAGPPAASYRLKKFLRRNKGPVLAGSLVFLALLAGIASTTAALIRAEGLRQLAEQNEREANKQLDKAVAAEQLAGNRLKQLDAEKRRTEQKAQERADVLGCLEALFGSSEVKTYEASDTERFVFVIFKDSNQYQSSVRDGFLDQGYGIMEDRLTIVRAGNDLMLSTKGKSGVGGGVGPFKHKPLGGVQGVRASFFERPISPAIGRPFTIFQLIIAEADGSGVTFSPPDLTRDPFDEIKPLPPMGSSKVRITRVTVQLMKVEKTLLRTGGSGISERPKEIKELFEDAIRLSRAGGGD